MYRCIVCAFGTEPDDAVMISSTGRCICLRCYLRETGSAKRMAMGLRRELIATLDLIETADA